MEILYIILALLSEYWVNLLLFILIIAFICTLLLLHLDEKYNNNLT